jgi:hypothetical protein
MSPIQKLTACTWPGCINTPSGAFCGRDRKRMDALGFSVRKGELPDDETIRRLPELWEARTAGQASPAEPQAGDLEDSRLACSQRIEERDKARRDLADARAVLGPRFSGTTESLTGDIQALLAYVRTVEEEGGHYALLCQRAHDELDLARVMSTGTPADRIRALLAAQAHKPESPRSTELEQYLARELLSELEENCDKSDPILRPLSMLRAIVTGEVPRG